jgi:hypothetical protein
MFVQKCSTYDANLQNCTVQNNKTVAEKKYSHDANQNNRYITKFSHMMQNHRNVVGLLQRARQSFFLLQVVQIKSEQVLFTTASVSKYKMF